MKFRLIAFAAVAALLLWNSRNSAGIALANGGFAGTWCGSSMSAYTITDSPRLMVKQGDSAESYAHYTGSQIVAERWAQTGTLSSDGSRITWGDGNAWVRTTAGAQHCGSFAKAATAPAANTNPWRMISWSDETKRRLSPIDVYHGLAAVKRDGTWVSGCVSFENEGSVAAKEIRFEFLLESQNGEVVERVPFDRTGTFSPNVEIHGYGSLADLLNRAGNRAHLDNCWGRRAAGEDEIARFLRVAQYTYRIEHIEFTDGTAWPSEQGTPAPSPSPSL
ncbi:MAG TPA: hypothetical protein VGI15_03425 [Candidatus Cybelea sp.]